MVIRDMANQHTVGKDAPWRDEETLRELYVERELSSREVAKELGCGKKAILRWLDRYDIPKRKPTKDRPPTIYTDPAVGLELKLKSTINNIPFFILGY